MKDRFLIAKESIAHQAIEQCQVEDGGRRASEIDRLFVLKKSRAYANSTLQVPGIRKKSGKSEAYEARISINGRQKSLGIFKTIEEASSAYQKADAKRRKEKE